MFAENKENAKINLQGRVLKSFFVILSSYVSFLIFALSFFCCLYLLVINTDFLGILGVFDNQYIHATLCAFTVIENIILLLFHIYIKLRKDVYFYFLDKSDDPRISVGIIFKAFCVYSLKAVKMFLALIFFVSPSAAVSLIIFSLLQQGISYFSLIAFSVSDFVLLIAGLYSYAGYVQKYQLLPFVLMKNKNESIGDIFSSSAELMNGKCRSLLILKLYNLPKKLLCLFLIPPVYYLPYCKTVETAFAYQKQKPYMRRKAYTEKPIVFYFTPVKET